MMNWVTVYGCSSGLYQIISQIVLVKTRRQRRKYYKLIGFFTGHICLYCNAKDNGVASTEKLFINSSYVVIQSSRSEVKPKQINTSEFSSEMSKAFFDFFAALDMQDTILHRCWNDLV